MGINPAAKHVDVDLGSSSHQTAQSPLLCLHSLLLPGQMLCDNLFLSSSEVGETDRENSL